MEKEGSRPELTADIIAPPDGTQTAAHANVASEADRAAPAPTTPAAELGDDRRDEAELTRRNPRPMMNYTDDDFRGVVDRLEAARTQIGEIGAIVYSGPAWSRPNYTEPPVLFAIRDLVEPGGTAFDVGANFGHLTIPMSRRSGPRGAVCAFEANPSIADSCQAALVRTGVGDGQ